MLNGDICKKRNNHSYIKNLLNVISNENFYICPSQFVSYTIDDLINYLSFSDDFLRFNFCYEQLKLKIDIESGLLAIMEAYISIQFCGSCAKHYGIDETKYKTLWTKSLYELEPFLKKK